MICHPCVGAGEAITAAKGPRVLPALRGTLLNMAREGHERCEATTTCACQHVVTLDALKP